MCVTSLLFHDSAIGAADLIFLFHTFSLSSCGIWLCGLLTCTSCQVRSATVESQLAETTAQLQELREKQKSLEARNILLEKLMKLNKQSADAQAPAKVNADEVTYHCDVDVVHHHHHHSHHNVYAFHWNYTAQLDAYRINEVFWMFLSKPVCVRCCTICHLQLFFPCYAH